MLMHFVPMLALATVAMVAACMSSADGRWGLTRRHDSGTALPRRPVLSCPCRPWCRMRQLNACRGPRIVTSLIPHVLRALSLAEFPHLLPLWNKNHAKHAWEFLGWPSSHTRRGCLVVCTHDRDRVPLALPAPGPERRKSRSPQSLDAKVSVH
jgi:hypothetical protein